VTPSDGPAACGGIPPAEIIVDERLVRALLESQQPDLAGLPLRHVATGWDNVTYRLGDRLAVRLPRIRAAAALIVNEQTWLPWLASRLPVAIPVPVRQGRAEADFPWPWSVVPWVAGRVADSSPLDVSEAGVFGRFLASLHQPPPAGFPRNDYRGVPLASLDETILSWLDTLPDGGLGVPAATVRDRWGEAVRSPIDVDLTCIHGDLHPRNLVVDRGRLAAVLDWGDMTGADPAADLAAAWVLFPVAAHAQVWDAYGRITAHTLTRAAGWAVFFGLTLVNSGLADDPVLAGIGRTTLERVCR
jgi:aminoglycoside phosphotransferase (APT) family kinase protein